MRRSRLSKNVEKKQQKTIFLSVVGIIIVLFLLFKFGIGLLVSFSLFLSGSKSQNSNTNSNQINFIAPPILNTVPSATNSATAVFAGKSSKDMTIELYINDKKVDEVQTDRDGIYVFNETLNAGDNQIKTRAVSNDKKSDFSNVLDVALKKGQPKLDLASPSDGQTFNKNSIGANNTITVSGTTDSGVSITVNGFWAVIDDNNNFSYNLPVQSGDNQIKIIATDQAGNKTEKDIKVNYSQ